jgi:hypothetical protein
MPLAKRNVCVSLLKIDNCDWFDWASNSVSRNVGGMGIGNRVLPQSASGGPKRRPYARCVPKSLNDKNPQIGGDRRACLCAP